MPPNGEGLDIVFPNGEGLGTGAAVPKVDSAGGDPKGVVDDPKSAVVDFPKGKGAGPDEGVGKADGVGAAAAIPNRVGTVDAPKGDAAVAIPNGVGAGAVDVPNEDDAAPKGDCA